jgi:uncharacterized membrane protein
VTETLLFVLLFGLGLMLFLTRADLKYLRRRIEELEGRAFGPAPDAPRSPEPVAEPEVRLAAKARRTAAVVSAAVAPPPPEPEHAHEPEPEPETPRPSPFADLSFESLVGGKLPIWVGGIALVFAGFFLVRYTIEAGLLGPAARSVIAAIFAFAMIAMSEFGGRLPKIGASFTADPRVAQSLAGAGVATLYGTLYMASEIYGLVVLPTSFVLVVLTTIIAFALSLRHGPPTALMGLIGGFAAPWVAGMGASNLPTLLLYLAVFIAALFGLAMWRRWLWLLVLASGGGALWSFAMLLTAKSDLSLLGGFIVVTGAGALIAAKRFAETKAGWSEAARYLPMALALVQLAILLPLMNFSATGWLFYFALSALSVALAWRDKQLLPLVGGALLLAALPLSGAWGQDGVETLTIAATLGIALLFGLAGHIHARRSDEAVMVWAAIALTAPMLCWFTAIQADSSTLSDTVWGATAAAAALASAYMAWDRHARARHEGGRIQLMATAATALMALMACAAIIDEDWMASYIAVVALGVAAWARVVGFAGVRRLGLLPLGLAMLVALGFSYEFLGALGESLSGQQAFYDSLPDISDALRTTLLPALLILAVTWQPVFASGRKTRIAAFAFGGAGVTAMAWLITKQPAAIATPSDFIRAGFAERALFTQALFALGWLALWQAKARPDWPSLRIAGWVLAGAALFRVVWFDLLLLNPVMVPQMVGPVPVANLLTGHAALVALWLWLLARDVPQRLLLTVQGASLGMMIVTVLASIRQLVQGNLVSGAHIETGENYLYSAALLALALAWLVLGMTRGSKLLRVGGLSLLTAVTLKVFLVDAAALTGLLRIGSFLGLGIALIGIGWAYGRVMGVDKTVQAG